MHYAHEQHKHLVQLISTAASSKSNPIGGGALGMMLAGSYAVEFRVQAYELALIDLLVVLLLIKREVMRVEAGVAPTFSPLTHALQSPLPLPDRRKEPELVQVPQTPAAVNAGLSPRQSARLARLQAAAML